MLKGISRIAPVKNSTNFSNLYRRSVLLRRPFLFVFLTLLCCSQQFSDSFGLIWVSISVQLSLDLRASAWKSCKIRISMVWMSDLDKNFHGRFLSIVFYGRDKPAPKFSEKSYDLNMEDLDLLSIGGSTVTY